MEKMGDKKGGVKIIIHWVSGNKCRVFASEPGRVGPELPGRHAPALTFHATFFSLVSIAPREYTRGFLPVIPKLGGQTFIPNLGGRTFLSGRK
jgi:hypothetical protein